VAVIRYRYSGEPLRLEDRLVNPLGFQVLRYRRDAEALPPEPATTPVVVQPAAPVGTVQVQSSQTTTQTTQTAPPPPRPAVPEPEL
jgi:type IV secretion system protein VirB8